jgi:hypothetical protein
MTKKELIENLRELADANVGNETDPDVILITSCLFGILGASFAGSGMLSAYSHGCANVVRLLMPTVVRADTMQKAGKILGE